MKTNEILKAYEAGKRIRRKGWKDFWIKKHSETYSIDEGGEKELSSNWSFHDKPEQWEIYHEDINDNPETPTHYGKAGLQPIDLIEAQNLNFNLGNVVKYVCRAGKKEGEPILKDLNKALDYLTREIKKHENIN